MIRWRSTSPDQTEACGARLAASLPAGADAPIVVYLSGDLGAGKTTFAKGFIRGCGIDGLVRSPTYALLEPYEAPQFTVLHLDLYRLQDPAELEALGLRDYARPGHLWLVEWPQRGGSALPAPDLQTNLSVVSSDHVLSLSAASTFGERWLARTDTA